MALLVVHTTPHAYSMPELPDGHGLAHAALPRWMFHASRYIYIPAANRYAGAHRYGYADAGRAKHPITHGEPVTSKTYSPAPFPQGRGSIYL